MRRRTAPTKSKQRRPPERLNQLENEIIDFFVRIRPLLGQRRSVAEIYGLLFSSARPLAFIDVIERLRLSKGSASHGLNLLLLLGAVRRTYVPARRSQHYEAVADLGRLTARLLRERIAPELRGRPTRLEGAARMAKCLPAAEQKCLNRRIRMLQDWQSKVRHLLRTAERVLTAGSPLDG